MAIEIERKFFVEGKPWDESTPWVDIDQGYLSIVPSATVRVRYEVSEVSPGESARLRGFITVKGTTDGATREEFEYEIPHWDAARLIIGMSQHAVRKRRYFVQHEGHEWHVDEFRDENQGLITAEIELTSEDEEFVRPDWAAFEITHDHRYANANLAINPWLQW